MKNIMARFVREEEGQDLIQVLAPLRAHRGRFNRAMTALGTSIVGVFNYIAGQLPPNVGG